MDTKGKTKFRDFIASQPLWGKGGDAMAKVLFPRAIKGGIAKHGRLILWAMCKKNRVILRLPRFHGKSTYVTFLYVMWCILTQNKKYIVVVSSTSKQAVKFLGRISYYLKHRNIKYYYGELNASTDVITTTTNYEYVETTDKNKKSAVWNSKEIYIEPWGIRIMATSVGSADRGLLSEDTRPDLYLLDDMEDRKNTNTMELRKRLGEKILEEIIPGGSEEVIYDIDGNAVDVEECQYIAIGTICHYGSYLLKLETSKSWYLIPFLKATDTIENIKNLNRFLPKEFPKEYHFDPKQEYFKEDIIGLDKVKYFKGDLTPEVALWQPNKSYERFCVKLEEAVALAMEGSFWQEHYNIPKSNEHQVISEFKYAENIEFKYVLGEPCLISKGQYDFPNGKKMINVYPHAGGDLAESEAEGADYTSIWKGFTDFYGYVYVMPPWTKKEHDPTKIGRYFLEAHKFYNFRRTSFDGQNFQKWFKSILKYMVWMEKDEYGKKIYKMPKVLQQPHRSEKKEKVIYSIISPLTTAGRLIFLGDKSKFANAENQLKNLGYVDYDDEADGLSYLCADLSYPPFIDFDNMLPIETKVRNSWQDRVDVEKQWYFA